MKISQWENVIVVRDVEIDDEEFYNAFNKIMSENPDLDKEDLYYDLISDFTYGNEGGPKTKYSEWETVKWYDSGYDIEEDLLDKYKIL